MPRLRDLPIRLKLTGIILLVSSLTLVAAAMTIIGYEASTARDRMAADLRGIAQLIGVNSRAALQFADADAATENLQALSARSIVISGALYTADGELFATYQRRRESPIPANPDGPRQRFVDGALELYHDIGHGTERVGTVYLRADVSPLDELLRRYALIVAGLFASVLLLSLLLAMVFQRAISRPVLDLAGVARAVTERQDYTLRARKHASDEIGLLTDALNQMLAQIHDQDDALRRAYGELEQRHQELEREIAERRRAEAAVRALNAELEQRVAARTAQLEAANAELEGFSYSVSHDLRSPLRAIDGFSRILADEYGPQLDAEAGRLIKVVRDNCRNMGQLIDDLLAFSRLGRAAVSTSLTDMQDLVAEVIEEMANVPGETLPPIEVGDLPPVRCDRALLRQVWVNLISNAVKFSGHNPRPRVRIWAEEAEGETVYAVSDNGVGFDMQYANKLFGVFQRLHRPDEFAGTGVGLAMVKRIVVRHGGRVWAQAALDEGATFYFALPTGAEDDAR
ncbi:HAMP domain-containing protein [Ectothiorhodospiraceae bacterium 2226]|nr:HAMP domain-containing protein [Ectothiorhodospiraceae bacterium 2226]